MEQEYGQANIDISYMTGFGDSTHFGCSLKDETIYELVGAFRRFLLSAGFHPDLVNDELGEEE